MNYQSLKFLLPSILLLGLLGSSCNTTKLVGENEYYKFDDNFIDYRNIIEYDNCPACNELKPAKQKFCSHKCASTNRRKVNWDSIDLLKLLKEHSIGQLEKMLGVSNAAIYKRRDKILKGNI